MEQTSRRLAAKRLSMYLWNLRVTVLVEDLNPAAPGSGQGYSLLMLLRLRPGTSPKT